MGHVMKVWEKYYQKGLRTHSSKEWKWKEQWEKFARTGECATIPCRFCPFFPDEWPCKASTSPETIIEELNKEVD